MRRSLATLGSVLLVVSGGLASCTITGDGPELSDDAEVGERIVDPFDAAAEEIAALPGLPGAQVARALDDAVANRDPCALLVAMDLDLPDSDDPDGAIEAYDALARAVVAAESFIPAEIEPWWPTIVDMSERGADAVNRVGGDLTHPSVAPIFTSAESQDAVAGIGRYRDAECAERNAATSSTTSTSTSTATSTTTAPA